jgi:hypothetical protein
MIVVYIVLLAYVSFGICTVWYALEDGSIIRNIAAAPLAKRICIAVAVAGICLSMTVLWPTVFFQRWNGRGSYR